MSAQKLFLDRYGVNQKDISFLAQDMSPRRYHRVAGKGLLFMQGPRQDLENYAIIANILDNLGATVPRIIGYEGEYAIIEDWGDNTLSNLLRQGHDASTLYSRAIDVLINLHQACQQNSHYANKIDAYDAHTMVNEATLFPLWCFDNPVSDQALLDYQGIWKDLHHQCPSTFKALVLRDYHVDNIMLTPQNELGLLDFQDALWGPCVYDVTSLLEDARMDVPSHVVEACLTQYRRGMGINESDWEDYLTAYNIWGLGRHLKIIGVFTRYAKKAGNASKLIHLPRVWGHVNRIMEAPIFHRLRKWMDHSGTMSHNLL